MSNSLAPNGQKYTGKPGDACITSSLLPHGLTGLATKIQRAMLPSYMAVSEDLTALKTKKSRSDNNIAKAHQNFELPPTFPCGHGHHYSANLYQFSAAVELANLSALSDALVCCHLWNSPAVLHERDIMLSSNVNNFIHSWHIKAVQEVLKSFQIVKEAEKAAYQAKLYFNLLDAADGVPFLFVEENSDPAPEFNKEDFFYHCC